MLFAEVVDASRAAAATRSRLAKTAAVAGALRAAGPVDAATVAAHLSGVLPQRRVGVSWRGLTALPDPAELPSVTVTEVDLALTALAAVGGAGSAGARQAAVAELFGRLTRPEQDFLRDLITGQMRQGALDGVMQAAIAAAAEVPEAAVRRAVMLAGYTGPVAAAALTGGVPALEAISLEVGRPLRPMLAGSAPDVGAALEAVGLPAAGSPGEPLAGMAYVDGKLDGIRLQAHRDGDTVRLFTRSLDDITDRLPEVVEAVLAMPARTLVLDGEAIALDDAGRPRPFQETASRTMSSVGVAELRSRVPVTPYFFDLLHLDGEDLLDAPAADRFARLAAVVPVESLVPRVSARSVAETQAFFDTLVRDGHEGIVVKSATAPYAAGRRGAGWVKVKPRHTLDLVVLAVEWGSGRRQGWLSNIHLGARDPESGGFVMLGKTFKGMTDEMLAWQTERFLTLKTSRRGHVVHLRPEQVVEVAFDGIQTSSRYPGGMALRFARVLRYRDDKTADEADTIELVRSLRG
ncbi:ATP-dependent DNA ligase [Nostocoides sp. HKS02]|uniref:ATP-dependent DNA ligase n=1 Tax=Nostocoides sp. HKS02 TaxID=1813880 RepID=UPI0012B44F70|nr:ATP-dependent DNA ligase [Tetrasphaera sp. HKS02]QGN57236.1 ATP-dependent DNA ligase [Tetrasphaera sp. HKS02]